MEKIEYYSKALNCWEMVEHPPYISAACLYVNDREELAQTKKATVKQFSFNPSNTSVVPSILLQHPQLFWPIFHYKEDSKLSYCIEQIFVALMICLEISNSNIIYNLCTYLILLSLTVFHFNLKRTLSAALPVDNHWFYF